MSFEKVLFVVCYLFISTNFVELKCSKESSHTLKTYEIDLDKPAIERFVQVASDYKNEIAEVIETQKKELHLNNEIISLIELVTSKLDDYFPYPFNDEIRGIAKGADANLGDIVFFSLIYDLTAYCTGIIARQKNNQIIHGRNLDYSFSDSLKNMTYLAKFKKNGTLLFTTAQTAGYIGILTGHKYNSFTFTINERDQGDWWINLFFAIVDRKASPLSFLTRNVMENATSFIEAVNMLETHDLIAPAYFIVAGVKPEEGVVITRSQNELIDAWKLNASSSGIESWYLLETNYDHWLPPPPDDDRRTPGMKAMNATTQANINYDTLMDVLIIDPVCNSQTVYSVVMSAANKDDDAIKIVVH